MVQSKMTTVIMDNGAYSIKLGKSDDDDPRVVPNCIVKSKHDRKRVYIGDQLEDCQDHSSLFFVLPFEKGYLVNWDVEQRVWDQALSPFSDDLSNVRLVLSDPNYLIPAIEDQSDEIIFEQFGIHSVFKGSASSFVAMSSAYSVPSQRCTLVVDCGYSASTVAAFIDGQLINDCIIRIDVGGKALTNQLKEWISYRELNVMEETYVVNECKEDACFVSMNIDKDLVTARLRTDINDIRMEYVLPDFITHQRGFLRSRSDRNDQLQSLTMNHERFMLPEALFRPSDIGVDQMGVAEAAAEVIGRAPPNLRSALARNITLIGGSTRFHNFADRFLRDLSVMLEWPVRLSSVKDPSSHAWQCAKKAVSSGELNRRFVTRDEWLEVGSDACCEKFLPYQ